MPTISIKKPNGKSMDLHVAPNQKVIEIVKSDPKKPIDRIANELASKTLTPEAYMLYMYFNRNIHGYTEVLLLDRVKEHTTLGPRMYYRAVNELIEKGYLKYKYNPEIKTYYLFYETLVSEQAIKKLHDENLSVDKIANKLGCSVETVKNVLSKEW